MKKRLSLLLSVCMAVALAGCKQTVESGKITLTPIENGSEQDVSKENTEVTSEDYSKGIVRKSPEFTKEIITNYNEHNFASSITVKEDKVFQSYQLDQQLQQELGNQEHTFQNPFIVLNPFGNSPLTAVVLFQTREEYAVRVTVEGNTNQTDVVGEVASGQQHLVPVIGLYPDQDNQVTLELIEDGGKTAAEVTITITTDPLPSSMEKLVDVKRSIKPSAYGLIEVSGFDTPHPFAFDTEGCVRWYLSETYASYGYFPLSNDRFIVMDSDVMIPTYAKPHAQQLYEMDYLGRVHQIYLINSGAHHEVIEKTPGGNLLVLSNSIDEHVEDVVQEIDRNTGEVVKSLDMREIFGETYVDMLDWAHLNTVSYKEEDDCIYLSVRNLHSAIKVNWSTGELVWILANPEFWEGTPFEDKVLQPEGDIIWNYQQHSVYEEPEDLDGNPDTIHIMMFDNHWDKTRKVDFFDGITSSFVSSFTIDEAARTITQPHTYEGIISKITSNYSLDYETGRVFFMGGYLAEETQDGHEGMIYEYDYETEEVLNQYGLRYRFYRAYEFNPDFNAVAKPMVLEDNYFKGTLRAAVPNPDAEPVPELLIEEDISLVVIQQLLYLKAGDHKISKIEFVGTNNSYLLDFSYTEEGEEKYHKLTYSLVVPFSNLEPDEYQLIITYDKVRYHTGDTITIN